MMIVVVMLSSAADMKKVIRASSHISLCLLRVLMWSVMTLKPPCESIRSTIVMAPIRNTSIAQVVDHVVADVRVVAQEAEDRPDGAAHQQCDGRFVDLNFVLQRDEGVADHEEQDHCQDHILSY